MSVKNNPLIKACREVSQKRCVWRLRTD